MILRQNLAKFEKQGYKTESQRSLPDDEYIGLANREQWIVASWKPNESAESTGNSEQIQQLLAEMRARCNQANRKLGPLGGMLT